MWKRVKVRPTDAFETAETQNIGKHLLNSITDNGGKINRKLNQSEQITSIKNEPTANVSTKEILEHVFSETTTLDPEIEEPNSNMFDEARRALTELFSTENESDDAVNMEESDEKLEALIDRTTTTTQISTTTDETSTTIVPTELITAESIANHSSNNKDKQIKTSTSQKVTGEICYRGRCIKTDEK